ncbi:MAG TPA: hypothetical protein VM674_04890 [Candidatus Acidoferrum sp.]|nr:hypothetical protein [Candidatus Acidoferrum sp.]
MHRHITPRGHRHWRHGRKLALKRHHHGDGGVQPPHWEGLPSISTVLVTLGVVFVIVATLTVLVYQNCTLFHVCSDYVRDAPHVYRP